VRKPATAPSLALAAALCAIALLALPALAPAATTICPPGSGAGQCDTPEGLAIDRSEGEASSGRLYVADSGNDRVVAFDEAGAFDLDFDAEGGLGTPTSVAVDNDETSALHRHIYVADFGNRRIVRFDPEGGEPTPCGEGEFAGATAMLAATGPGGEIYVAYNTAVKEGGIGTPTTVTTHLRRYEAGCGAPVEPSVEVNSASALGALASCRRAEPRRARAHRGAGGDSGGCALHCSCPRGEQRSFVRFSWAWGAGRLQRSRSSR
jgi:hypothetical protein